jgi:ankyrin repeat protein
MASSLPLLRLAVLNDNNVDALKVIKHYPSRGMLNSSRSERGTTLLHDAARSGSVAVLDTLLRSGKIDVNKLEDKSVGGYSALHAACASGNIEAVRKLIAANADLNIRSNSTLKETALHVCCKADKADCAIALVSAGASVDIRDSFGRTASFWAKVYGNLELISAAGLPAPTAVTAKMHLDLLSERCRTRVVIPPPKGLKKAGKKGDKKSSTARKKK